MIGRVSHAGDSVQDAVHGLADQLERAGRAVCRILPIDANNNGSIIGTGFVVRDGLYVITAEHVIRGAKECIVIVCGSDRLQTTAQVLAIDVANDIAVLKLGTRAPVSLSVQSPGLLEEVGPLVCWEDSAAPSALSGAEISLDGRFSLRIVGCLPLSLLSLRSVQGGARLALAGKLRAGMSGGPVFAPLSGSVVGVVSATPPYDPFSVVDAWADYGRSYENLSEGLGADVEVLLKAHLGSGIGIAVPAVAALALLGASIDAPVS